MLRATAILLATISRSMSLATKAPGITELKYFAIRGVAETSRILLALGGEEYKDTRYSIGPKMEAPEFTAAKESGELIMNLNRAPVLITAEGDVIGQSKAIERYLAKKFDLMGKSPVDEALIDCVIEHCRDVKLAEQRKGFSFFVKDKTEEEKEALRKEWYATDLPSWLSKIEESVKISGSNGFAVGSSLTYADVVIFCLLKDCSPSDLEDTKKACESCTALKAIAENVASNSKVADWIKCRPESMF